MDRFEELAFEFLNSHYGIAATYEPRGKASFPDFSIDGRVAAEVTSLEKYVSIGPDQTVGVRETYFGIRTSIENALSRIPRDRTGRTYCVAVRFRRPVSIPKVREFILREIPALAQEVEGEADIGGAGGASFSILSLDGDKTPTFWIGLVSDMDASGWVYDDVRRSIENAIQYKTNKINDALDLYSEFHLVLINTVTGGAMGEGADALRDLRFAMGPWNAISLIGTDTYADHVTIRQ